ncbi:splicing factor, CC1-like protein [Zopfia rhizophila CBS 207.26]|uniref:Splicing factor, CC1-like protein n=1 Tax=Zopfia rhizophila CBS 207.26 TaxID=1314779 RepID=A0A6A6EX72_9PEZI|nr:splicing factor, CC1-like protein [Zopfia rhizophila CBS 207.26]
MSSASGVDVEALLESAEKKAQLERDAGSQRLSQSSDEGRRHDTNSDRRDRDRDRERRANREYNSERHRSRDRERKRRDHSRPRSSYKDADTNEEGYRNNYDRASPNGSSASRRRDYSRERGARRGRRSSDEFGDRRGDHWTGSGHTRSRSPRRDRHYPSYRERDDYHDRDRRRDRARDRSRDRSRDRYGDRARDNRRSPKTPEPNEDERDKRTIFVQQLAARLRTKELIAFFSKVGEVVQAMIVKDRVSQRSKGVGYVEFKDEESVAKAIELTGQKLLGIPIIAQLTEAEKNRQARPTESANGNANGAPFHRLYVGNIHFSVTEQDLAAVFEPFGELEFVQLQKEDAGRSKGYGFVQFRDPTQAKQALEQMNGFELANRPIRVGLGNDRFTPESTANLLRTFGNQTSSQPFQGSAFSGQGGRGAHAGGSGGTFDRAHGRDNDRGASGASALDDTDVGGVNFNNFSRESLMRKLARIDEPESNGAARRGAAATASKPALPSANTPMPSKCIKISNLFDPDEELKHQGPNWVKELEKDVQMECEKKYGRVVHLAVDPNSQGDVYVKFDSVSGGEKAIQGLNGRLFSGRQLLASYVVDKIYNSLYGRASSRDM